MPNSAAIAPAATRATTGPSTLRRRAAGARRMCRNSCPLALARAASLGSAGSVGRERRSSSSAIVNCLLRLVFKSRATQPAAGARDARADSPERQAERDGNLLVRKVAPGEQQQRLALAPRQRLQSRRQLGGDRTWELAVLAPGAPRV